MKLTFNKEAYNARVNVAVEECTELIKSNWEKGIPGVVLEVDSDIYVDTKNQVLSLLDDQACLSKLTVKAYSLPGKNGKTKFKITPKTDYKWKTI
jgi:hypothetical protein